MREIKFRAWHKKQKVMFDVGGFANIDYSKDNQYRYVTLAGKSAGVTGDDVTPQIQTVEIMQYTGLKDKNGVEIFELDHLGDYEIRWKQDTCNYILHNIATSDIMDCNEQNTAHKTITGNRFVSEDAKGSAN